MQHSLPPAIIVLDTMAQLLQMHRHLSTLLGEAYAIVLTHDPETVLHHIDIREVPIVFTEYNTWGSTGMTGIQLVHELKQRSPDTVAVMSASDPEPDLEATAGSAGVDIYLRKPIALPQLQKAVEHGLALFGNRKEARSPGYLERAYNQTPELLAPPEELESDTGPTQEHLELARELDTRITAVQLQAYGLASALTNALRIGTPPSIRWLARLTSLETECRELVSLMRAAATTGRNKPEPPGSQSPF
jgi:CheY-like chemotaxis protein